MLDHSVRNDSQSLTKLIKPQTPPKVPILIAYSLMNNMYSLMIQHAILVALSLVVSLAGSSSVQPLCHTDERHALLSFKASFTILDFPCNFVDFSDNCAKTRSWKSGIRDCCQWDGVTCDPLTGHVTELHLSNSLLNGSFPSNSTLFSLRRLRHIDLSFNYFMSPIPSGFGRLSDLTYLNLSNSGFSGQVPPEIGWLSSLTSLDLSNSDSLRSGPLVLRSEPLLKMPNFKTSIANLTDLRELHLSNLFLNTDLPPLITNLSKLTSLKLANCGLQGHFLATSILSLPKLRVLDLGGNELHADFSASAVQWTSPLEVVDLSDCNFTGKLPDSIGDSSNSSLISFNTWGCGFHGSIPGWMWNVTEEIVLGGNKFSGSLPRMMNTVVLSTLSTIRLDENNITGTIPAWLFTLPSLTYLSLDENLFTGIDQFTITNSSTPSVLSRLLANNNQLRGQIPEGIFELHNLKFLYLGGNNLTATILLSKLHGLQNLSELSLSHNYNISFIDDIGAESISSWPSFSILDLSSCNLDQFPIFLRDQENLVLLDLSKNAIHGHLPEWFLGINTIWLLVLDLSHNFLTGGLEHLQWNGQRQGITHYFVASNNHFSKEIPSSLCNLTNVDVVDISQNKLTGNIPDCFASLIRSQTSVLDLSQNQLQGVIPSTIFEDCNLLRGFRLNGNRLEGPIPRSLSNCMYMEFIDLSNNILNGTFPHWLGVLPNLKGLILSSNNLQGSLMSPNTTSSFLKLKILDISSNHFTGDLPDGFLMSLKAMIEVDHRDQDPRSQYMDYFSLGIGYGSSVYIYEDSMNAWFKGFNHQLHKILKTLVLIDASRNRLEGSIPEVIGDLVSLRWLNLAHNNFTGHIPPSLGKLNLLESLDMSFNGLDGNIPNELVNLNSLEFFNVSDNHLAGSIPTGKQFYTFSNDSYLGNLGLCGAPLTKKCGKRIEVPKIAVAEGNNNESSSLDAWEIALTGFGVGMFVSSVWGYFILWEKNYLWVCKLMLEVQVFIMLHLMRRR